ncbi:VOC family protein [Actinomadura nitritigenes]|uniref:VOC family protein n=1 Tax=Actinomadura nitritigenes TaxID=134602 RepID=UPI003D8E6603
MDTAPPQAPPVLGSILLASTDPGRLRAWYEQAFGASADGDGFLRLGGVGLLIDGREDVATETAEPARVILNLHVEDARATARHLDALDVSWLAGLEYRERAGAWFGTVVDPDGNLVQIVQPTAEYWTARRERLGLGGAGILAAAHVATRLPAQDLGRARRFYAEKLGLEPVEARPGGLRYECGGGVFALFESAGRPSGEHTQMGWRVEDLDATVAELRDRGVVFEEYQGPGLRTAGGIAVVAGNYPSHGGAGERAAWFYDSEGNLHGVGQAVRPDAAG